MGQNITLKMAGKVYKLTANSPERERLMRTAAELVNDSLAAYDSRYPEQSLDDKLVFVALNQAVARLAVQDEFASMAEDLRKLQSDTDAYLAGVDNG